MYKIQKGEYECPQCKKLTIIGRTKKSEEPLTCCDQEMVFKEKVKFTEPPAPKEEDYDYDEDDDDDDDDDEPSAKKSKKSKKKKKKKKKSSRRKKKVVIEATLPLAPGRYLCPTCGLRRELSSSDRRDQWLRCTDCFVKMIPTG